MHVQPKAAGGTGLCPLPCVGLGWDTERPTTVCFRKAEVGDFQLTCLGLGGASPDRELISPGPGAWGPVPGLSEFPKHRARDAERNSRRVLGRGGHVSAYPSEARENASDVGTGGGPRACHSHTPEHDSESELAGNPWDQPARPLSLQSGRTRGGRGRPRSQSPGAERGAQWKRQGHVSWAVGHRAQTCSNRSAAESVGSASSLSFHSWVGAEEGTAAFGLLGAERR